MKIVFFVERTEPMDRSYPVLHGKNLFREGESVYINRSDELQEFCNILHKHDFIEIAYVFKGSGIHIVGDREYATEQGDLFVINYDEPHGFFPGPGSPEAPIVYNCVFMPEFLGASLLGGGQFKDITTSFLFKSLFPHDLALSPDLRLQGADYREFGELFEKMRQEYRLRRKGYSDIIRAYLIELIVKLFRYMDERHAKQPSGQHRRLIEKALEYLRRNYMSTVKLEELAMNSFISKNYFSKLFKEVTGINFSDYIQKLRIDEACHLLKDTDLKVIDIAQQVGMKDLKFFYEVFKKFTGRTPGDYRRNA